MAERNDKKIVISRISEEQCETCGLPKGKGEQGAVCACIVLEGLPLLCELNMNMNEKDNSELRM